MTDQTPAGAWIGTYPPPETMPADAAAVWKEIVDAHESAGDESISRKLRRLESYAYVVAIQRTAGKRALEYGDTVQDARGAPVRNPAVDIVNDQNRELSRWADTFEPKPARTTRGRR